MYSAPAVSYPVGRSRFEGQLIGGLTVIGCATGLFWWSFVDMPGWRQALFFVILLAACLVSVRAWLRSPAGVLAWEGPVWRCTGAFGVTSGKVTLHLDLQFCMLLCLRPHDGERLWLCPEQRTAPADWLALRRAVISSPSDRASLRGAQAPDVLKP